MDPNPLFRRVYLLSQLHHTFKSNRSVPEHIILSLQLHIQLYPGQPPLIDRIFDDKLLSTDVNRISDLMPCNKFCDGIVNQQMSKFG